MFPPTKDRVVLYNARDSLSPTKLRGSSFEGDPMFDDPDIMDEYLTSVMRSFVQHRVAPNRLKVRKRKRKPSK